MSNYNLSLTGTQVNSALNKVHNADGQPTNGSQNMITSDAVNTAVNNIGFDNLESSLINSDLAAGSSSNTISTSAAVKTYVDSNAPKSLSSGYTLLSQNTSSHTGTVDADGFLIIAYRPNDTGDRSDLRIEIGGVTFPEYESSYLNSNIVTLPIANGESYDIEITHSNYERVYFKEFS
tara:strand:+ start:105 stop:638 length:534 start_codon:yes stop_codon:yes gene_type:complete